MEAGKLGVLAHVEGQELLLVDGEEMGENRRVDVVDVLVEIDFLPHVGDEGIGHARVDEQLFLDQLQLAARLVLAPERLFFVAEMAGGTMPDVVEVGPHHGEFGILPTIDGDVGVLLDHFVLVHARLDIPLGRFDAAKRAFDLDRNERGFLGHLAFLQAVRQSVDALIIP